MSRYKRDFSAILKLINNINANISFNDMLSYIYSSFSDFIPYSHIGIALLKDDGKVLEASYGISSPALNGLSGKLAGIRADIGKTSLESVINTGKPRVINNLEEYIDNNESKLYNSIILEAGVKSSVTLPLKLRGKSVGIIFFSSDEKDTYKAEHIAFLEAIADSIAISLNHNIFIDELVYGSILALAKMAESRDEDTGEHLDRIKDYVKKIARFLSEDNSYSDIIDVEFTNELVRFSPMHDIGKVGILDGILLKPGRLTEDEFAEMKKHTIYGADVLRAADGYIEKHGKSLFKTGIEIAEGHHEKWDGSGYPHGKSKDEIPLSARIVAVADVFDALTSKRPYKEAYSFDRSFGIITEGSGKHFDPVIIESITRHKDELHEVYISFEKSTPM